MNVGLLGGAFGLGATLGILPGPVQMVLLGESTRGGAKRGFAAMAGANGTMGLLMLTLAAGVAFVSPGSGELRILRIGGGLFLLFMAFDAIRSYFRRDAGQAGSPPATAARSPLLRGSMSVILNPGAWIFLATTAAALFATAQHSGGKPLAFGTALAMLAGVALIDGSMVMLGDGVRRFEQRIALLLSPVIGCVLAVFGVVLLVQGITG